MKRSSPDMSEQQQPEAKRKKVLSLGGTTLNTVVSTLQRVADKGVAVDMYEVIDVYVDELNGRNGFYSAAMKLGNDLETVLFETGFIQSFFPNHKVVANKERIVYSKYIMPHENGDEIDIEISGTPDFFLRSLKTDRIVGVVELKTTKNAKTALEPPVSHRLQLLHYACMAHRDYECLGEDDYEFALLYVQHTGDPDNVRCIKYNCFFPTTVFKKDWVPIAVDYASILDRLFLATQALQLRITEGADDIKIEKCFNDVRTGFDIYKRKIRNGFLERVYNLNLDRLNGLTSYKISDMESVKKLFIDHYHHNNSSGSSNTADCTGNDLK